jgi:hypothetical protein
VEEENQRCLAKSLQVEKKVDVGSKDIEKWIRQVVAKKHKTSGATICPFAKKTVEDRKIQITMAKEDVLDQIDNCCGLFNIFHLDIVILYFNNEITERKLSNICKKAHQANPDYAIMYDHPYNNKKIKGVQFSFQKAPLLFIQNLNKLRDAQRRLQKTDYYRTWGLDADSDMFY